MSDRNVLVGIKINEKLEGKHETNYVIQLDDCEYSFMLPR